ncbi:ATP-binding protein [Streptomyces sp. CA-132043]|uniref:ATP-binding protein n=1 Tax=Streptomyces sp. CA-132043 TaxID=3240048 RepID=UPI003D921A0F
MRHAEGPIGLRVWHSVRELGVEISDHSVPRPRARLAESMEENGRGLILVEALAAAWGTRPTTVGKTVWFTLLLPPAPGHRPPPGPPPGEDTLGRPALTEEAPAGYVTDRTRHQPGALPPVPGGPVGSSSASAR